MALSSAWLPISSLHGTLPALPPCCLALGPLPFCLFGMWCSAHWHLCWFRLEVFMFGCWFLHGSLGLVLRSSCRWPLGCPVCTLQHTMGRRCPASFPTCGTGYCWSSGADVYSACFAGVDCRLPLLGGGAAGGPGGAGYSLLFL